MMTEQNSTVLNLTPALGGCVVAGYIALRNFIDYSDAIVKDKDSQGGLKNIFAQHRDKAKWIERDIARRFTGLTKEYYEKELRDNDLLKFDEVKNLMIQMSPEQQDFVETMCAAMIKGEKIIVEHDNGKIETA